MSSFSGSAHPGNGYWVRRVALMALDSVTEFFMSTHTFKFYTAISVFFVSILLISNVASTKLVSFFGLTLDGGTILFPLSYIFADILTEVYGFRRSRSVIWLGFFSALVMSLVFIIVGALPAAPEWGNQAAYDAILGLTPFIVIGSLVAYFCGEFSNSYLLAKMKIWMHGKHLWARTIGSTLVGQLVDSSLFVIIAFGMMLPGSVLIALIVSNYVFKVAVEVLFTPVTYAAMRFLKESEGVDVYDVDTNFNPFKRA